LRVYQLQWPVSRLNCKKGVPRTQRGIMTGPHRHLCPPSGRSQGTALYSVQPPQQQQKQAEAYSKIEKDNAGPQGIKFKPFTYTEEVRGPCPVVALWWRGISPPPSDRRG
jgi:hypothetical protein